MTNNDTHTYIEGWADAITAIRQSGLKNPNGIIEVMTEDLSATTLYEIANTIRSRDEDLYQQIFED